MTRSVLSRTAKKSGTRLISIGLENTASGIRKEVVVEESAYKPVSAIAFVNHPGMSRWWTPEPIS